MAIYEIKQITSNGAPIPFPRQYYYAPSEMVYELGLILDKAATALSGDSGGFPELREAAATLRTKGTSCLHDGTITPHEKVAITYEVKADFADDGIYF